MQRVVSVWLPQFPIERLRRTLLQERGLMQRSASGIRPDQSGASASFKASDKANVKARVPPFALVESKLGNLLIVAVNAVAAAAGIMPGQALADACAALPSLRTRPAERARDAAVLIDLARWSGRYGPHRNTEGCDGLWIDLTGSAHLFGGEAALLSDMHKQLSAAGYSARLGLADTAGAAWALARFGCNKTALTVAPVGQIKAALAELPVAALRLTPASVLLLHRLGLYRIGQLYGLPRESLARRFRDLSRSERGASSTDAFASAVILRLDQALGTFSEPRRPLLPPPCRLVRQVFVEPLISAAGIEAALAMSIEQLCMMLSEASEGARHLCLTLYRTDGTRAEVTIGTSCATRDQRHLSKLLIEKLRAIDLGFGIDVITLEGVVVEPLDASQSGLGAKPRGRGAQGLVELIDRLGNRLDAGAIYRVAPRHSHLPEQADISVPVFAPHEDYDDRQRPDLPSRPPFLLRLPEQIAVVAEVPEGPPRRFLWRRARHRIVKAEGPERIECAWWQTLGPTASPGSKRPRDYYRVEDDKGGRYWVFREGLYDREADLGVPVWYVHGLFG